MPFDIPDNWAWARFGNLVDIQTGASFSKGDSIQENKEGYIRVLRGGNIIPFKYLFKPDDLFIPTRLINDSIRLQEFDLITPAVTSLENIGKVAVIDKKIGNTTAGGFVYIFRPFITNIYISLVIMKFMSSSLFQKLMKEITKKSGQAFYNMNKEKLKGIYFPLPPLEEQQRIVDKINSFEPLLQEYEGCEKKLTELESTFSDRFKKSILQYAIEGKLVKQDPNDEPASVLLERIKAEKEQLIKEGKIKRDKNESYIYQGDDKNYYENLPVGWTISKLNSICTKIVDGNHNPPSSLDYKTDYIMLSSQNIGDLGLINLDKVRYIKKEQFLIENERTKISMDDILFTSVGTIGRSCIYKQQLNICFQRSVSVIHTLINPEYLKYFLDAPEQQFLFVKEATGTAQKGFYLNQLSKLLVKIPPLYEQKRIVNKINMMLVQIKD